MALTWDVGAVKDFETVCFNRSENGNKHLKPTTNSLIWLSMPCGYGVITEKNWEEVFKRIRMYEMARGAFNSNAEGDVMITPSEVKEHIGLRTNASSYTFPAFKANLCRVLYDEARDALYWWKENHKEKEVAG